MFIENDAQLIQSMHKKGMEEEILYFIRCKLSDDGRLTYKDDRRQGLHFEMSGYGDDVTSHNMSILNKFEYMGIYDYTGALFIDFYKGSGVIYWSRDVCPDDRFGLTDMAILSVGGMSTSEIIFEIFKITILSGKNKRRRS